MHSILLSEYSKYDEYRLLKPSKPPRKPHQRPRRRNLTKSYSRPLALADIQDDQPPPDQAEQTRHRWA